MITVKETLKETLKFNKITPKELWDSQNTTDKDVDYDPCKYVTGCDDIKDCGSCPLNVDHNDLREQLKLKDFTLDIKEREVLWCLLDTSKERDYVGMDESHIETINSLIEKMNDDFSMGNMI